MSGLEQQAAPAAAPSSASVAAALPLRRDASPAWQTGGLGVPAALALVLLLALGAAWWIRRRQRGLKALRVPSGAAAGGDFWRQVLRGQSADGLRLMQSVRLGSRASVHVVQWAGKQWLLGATDHGVTLIAQHGDAAGHAAMDEVASPEQSA